MLRVALDRGEHLSELLLTHRFHLLVVAPVLVDLGTTVGESQACGRVRAKDAFLDGGREQGTNGLGKQRWVVERTIAWLHQYRRLRVRYERRADIHEAFLAIGCSLICLKLLQAEAPF